MKVIIVIILQLKTSCHILFFGLILSCLTSSQAPVKHLTLQPLNRPQQVGETNRPLQTPSHHSFPQFSLIISTKSCEQTFIINSF